MREAFRIAKTCPPGPCNSSLLDELRLHYLHANQIAVRAERDNVKAAGVSWRAYQRFMKKYESAIEEETIVKMPSLARSHALSR